MTKKNKEHPKRADSKKQKKTITVEGERKKKNKKNKKKRLITNKTKRKRSKHVGQVGRKARGVRTSYSSAFFLASDPRIPSRSIKINSSIEIFQRSRYKANKLSLKKKKKKPNSIKTDSRLPASPRHKNKKKKIELKD